MARRGRKRRLEVESESGSPLYAGKGGAYGRSPSWQLCHETIYQALYRGRAGLSRALTRRLRTGRPLRKRRHRPEPAG